MGMIENDVNDLIKAQNHIDEAIRLLAEHRQDAPLDSDFKIFDEVIKIGAQLCKTNTLLTGYSEAYRHYFNEQTSNPISHFRKAAKEIRKKGVALELFLHHVSNARKDKKARLQRKVAYEQSES